nr:L-type lectin-domain containing receptor kinase IX.1-like [Arachis hypogaea]XP_029154021.1 L-type lectin-domain containing receptor kinase IX.1-like [Arachis hypogaea]
MFDHFIGFNFQHSNDMAHSLIPLYIVVAVLILVTIGIISIIRRFVYCLKCISKMISQSGSDKTLVNTLRNLPGTPKEYRFEDLKMATNNFDDVKNKLGQGGFGAVYRGTLPKDKTQVAVKKFLRDKISSTHDFLAELTIINSLRHKNLVRLLGLYIEVGGNLHSCLDVKLIVKHY